MLRTQRIPGTLPEMILSSAVPARGLYLGGSRTLTATFP
jgi:hypothetical protein